MDKKHIIDFLLDQFQVYNKVSTNQYYNDQAILFLNINYSYY